MKPNPNNPATAARGPLLALFLLCLLSLGLSVAAILVSRSRNAGPGGPDLQARVHELEATVAGLQRAHGGTPASANPAATGPAASPAADVPAAGAAPAGASGPYEVVSNAELAGRLGRIVVSFPISASDTHSVVFPAAGTDAIASIYGQAAFELLPGTYEIEVGGRRMAGVPVQSRHDTRIKAGILRIKGGSSTQFSVYTSGGNDPLQKAYGTHDFGLPAGDYEVMVSGQRATVTVTDGQITDF